MLPRPVVNVERRERAAREGIVVFNVVAAHGERPAEAPGPRAPVTLAELIASHADAAPQAPALLSRGRAPMTRRELVVRMHALADALRQSGVMPGERVALAMPTGLEMATALCTLATGHGCAPLNPALHASEFERDMRELRVRALVVDASMASAASSAAGALGIPVIAMPPPGETTAPTQSFAPSRSTRATNDDALVLHTSGTTSRAKIVVLSQARVCASALAIARSLALGPGDRCLSVNPLHHIHGIMVTLASLASGGSVACMPPLAAAQFVELIDDVDPTWYSAVPTVHQAILAAIAHAGSQRLAHRLRFVRSSSASMPASVRDGLERVFGVPVIESYGMTEAAHQIATNPLPPGARKAGSVGVAAGPEVAIVDESGRPLSPGLVGEVAIRGASVIDAYENGGDANLSAFVDGWLRTGDLGHVDADGYLFLGGRIKELVNRGGEKIAPLEIEAVLAMHASVAQAVVFPVPHALLGEDVAAAVVLRAGARATAQELRRFVAQRLADYKVPRTIAIVERIPTGPTGKHQRRLLASQLGLDGKARCPAASRGAEKALDALEWELVRIWERLFDVAPIGVADDFFDLGGHSLLAAQMLDEVERICGWSAPPSILHDAPTIAALASALVKREGSGGDGPALVTLQPGRDRAPFVLLHGDYNGGGFYCRNIARRLDARQPFLVCPPHGSNGDPVPPTIDAMADDVASIVLAAIPAGPIVLGGFSQAGLVAFEVARRVRAAGRFVQGLVVIDKPVEHPRWRILAGVVDGLGRLRRHDVVRRRDAYLAWQYRVRRLRDLVASGPSAQVRYLVDKLTRRSGAPSRTAAPPAHGSQGLGRRQQHLFDAYAPVVDAYAPRRYAGRLTVIASRGGATTHVDDPSLGWRHVARHVDVRWVPGDHLTCLTEHVDALAECLDDWLAEVARDDGAPEAAVATRYSALATMR